MVTRLWQAFIMFILVFIEVRSCNWSAPPKLYLPINPQIASRNTLDRFGCETCRRAGAMRFVGRDHEFVSRGPTGCGIALKTITWRPCSGLLTATKCLLTTQFTRAIGPDPQTGTSASTFPKIHFNIIPISPSGRFSYESDVIKWNCRITWVSRSSCIVL